MSAPVSDDRTAGEAHPQRSWTLVNDLGSRGFFFLEESAKVIAERLGAFPAQ
jgi:hypothetical protein